MTLGILALQGDVREHAAAFADVGEEVRPVTRPSHLEGVAGLTIPGGESTTLSLLLGSSGLAGPLGEALADGLPVFGTCAGMILLAGTVLDGRADQLRFGVIDLEVRRNGYGRQVASFETEVEVPVLGPAPLHAVFIRAPVVAAVGTGVEVLATLGGRPGQTADHPVVCRQGPVLVASFHPELTGDRRLHEYFVGMTKQQEEIR